MNNIAIRTIRADRVLTEHESQALRSRRIADLSLILVRLIRESGRPEYMQLVGEV